VREAGRSSGGLHLNQTSKTLLKSRPIRCYCVRYYAYYQYVLPQGNTAPRGAPGAQMTDPFKLLLPPEPDATRLGTYQASSRIKHGFYAYWKHYETQQTSQNALAKASSMEQQQQQVQQLCILDPIMRPALDVLDDLTRTQHKQRTALQWACAVSHAIQGGQHSTQEPCQQSRHMLSALQHHINSTCDAQHTKHPWVSPTHPDSLHELSCTLRVPHAGHQATATRA